MTYEDAITLLFSATKYGVPATVAGAVVLLGGRWLITIAIERVVFEAKTMAAAAVASVCEHLRAHPVVVAVRFESEAPRVTVTFADSMPVHLEQPTGRVARDATG